jgi:endonuclease-3
MRYRKTPNQVPVVSYTMEQLHAVLEHEYGHLTWRPRMDPTSELIQTILSQHTSDINSERAFLDLRRCFDSWDAVLEASVEEVSISIQHGGLGRQKAPRIQEVLRSLKQRTGGYDISFLAELPLDDAKAWLKSLPGVGPKTAAVVLCFALGRPAFPVDTHIHRVSKRLGIIQSNVNADKAHELLEKIVKQEHVFSLHMYLIGHGRKVCKAIRPLCNRCILSQSCPSRQTECE